MTGLCQSIHVIGSKQFGGADRFYVRLVRALNASGHRALAVNRPHTPISRALDGVVEQVHIPMRNGWDLLSVFAIRRLVKQRQAPVVQTYMGRATRLTRLPPHCEAIHIARLGGYYKIKGYYEHAHAWIGNTRGVCDYLIRHGLPARRVYKIGNFVEIPSPTPAEELTRLRVSVGIPQEAIVLFSLARFIHVKGVDDLLAAFALLPAQVLGRPLHLVIAGDGPLRKQLLAQADQLALPQRIHWVGWQDRPSPYYHLADLFVCPSRHETLGNVLLEAWAHGLPVIATRTPGALELVTEGENGVLLPCNDPPSLAGGLLEVIHAGASQWRNLAQNGYRTLNENYSETAVVGAYLDLYRELHGRGG